MAGGIVFDLASVPTTCQDLISSGENRANWNLATPTRLSSFFQCRRHETTVVLTEDPGGQHGLDPDPT